MVLRQTARIKELHQVVRSRELALQSIGLPDSFDQDSFGELAHWTDDTPARAVNVLGDDLLKSAATAALAKLVPE